MKIVLALAAVTGCVVALAADDPVAIVRGLRAESNAAIGVHDVKRLRPLLADDYRGIQGTSGGLDTGGAATARSYENEEFRDPTFVAYERIPDKVTLARSGRRIGESGHWVGTWRKADGVMRKTGDYLAVWTVSKGQWRLRSESFVTLSCTGSSDCQTAG
ncbi:MAG: nuclear transport factor 2 family protein [Gammaproteobacteria bacterium]